MLRASCMRASPLCDMVRGVGRVLEAALLPAAFATHTAPSPTRTTATRAADAAALRTRPLAQRTSTTTRVAAVAEEQQQHSPPPPPMQQQPVLSPQLVEALSQTRYSEAKTLECRPVPATRVARAASFTSLLLQIAWDKAVHATRAKMRWAKKKKKTTSKATATRTATSTIRDDDSAQQQRQEQQDTATTTTRSNNSNNSSMASTTVPDAHTRHDAPLDDNNNDVDDGDVVVTHDDGILPLDSHERIARTLCRMRGVVLKLAQMLSMQDDTIVPPAVMRLFARARDQAYAMPRAQLHATLAHAYDDDAAWRSRYFVTFDDRPVAAASIGQVHYARLRAEVAAMDAAAHEDGGATEASSSNNNADDVDGVEVAVKVQYPGVAQSIDADVANLRMLISLNVLPPGMFVDKVLAELRRELAIECQYTLEAQKQERYRALVASEAALRACFRVPRVFARVSRQHVLVSEFVRGVPLDTLARRHDVPQSLRNYLAEQVMTLTLYELFKWHFMQTDPNYANFLYDAKGRCVHLLDFGAARAYEVAFVRDYCDVVAAAARGDGATVVQKSIALGFLTGYESREMVDAHVASVLLLGKPFRDRDAAFDFARENLPQQIRAHVPTMVRLRLTSPPTPIYSLHRRLSGVILLATRFGATVHCGSTFWQLHDALQQRYVTTS